MLSTLDQEVETAGTNGPEKTYVKAERTEYMDLENCKMWQVPWTWTADTRVSCLSDEHTARAPPHGKTIQWPLRTTFPSQRS